MQKKTRATLAVFAVAGVAAAAIAYWISSRPMTVPTVGVETREISEVYVVTGRVRSRTTSTVGSELAGRVAKVHVTEGAKPKRTDPLIDLQPMDAELGVKQAEANLEIARRELERVRRGPTKAQREQAEADVAAAKAELDQARKDLSRAEAMARDGVGTAVELERARSAVDRARARFNLAKARRDELEESPRSADIRVAQARLDAAEANLEQSRATLGKTTINAPFDGLVLEVQASVGENARPGEPLLTLVRIDDLEFHAEVDESYFGRLAPGQKATAVFSSIPDAKFSAEITQVGPDVDPDRGVVAVHLDPESLPEAVVPGLSADVAIELARIENARAVPVRALGRDEGTYVLAIRDGVATRVPVEVEAEGEEWVAISTDEEIDQVIADVSLVEAGQEVRAE